MLDGWPQFNDKGPCQQCEERLDRPLLTLKMHGGAQECRWPPEARKAREARYPLEPPEKGRSPVDT